MIALALAAGLVNWLATVLVVDSELARPLRDLVCRRREAALWRPRLHEPGSWRLDDSFDHGVWRWLDYLLRCHLCTGVWVGMIEAAWLGPIVGRGVLGWAFTALLIKAIGHLVLELVGVLKAHSRFVE